MRSFRYILTAFLTVLVCQGLFAQTDRREVRSGNRQFKKGNWQESEIDYRKAQLKDTTSFAASYNLANSLYRQDNFEEAGKALDKLKDSAPDNLNGADYYYNLGNVAVKKKDWSAAVEAYKQSLLRRPEDMDAKENYAYAKLMLQKDNQNQDQNQDQGQGQGDAKISPQQAQQMLNAIQAREKETQEKVGKEKAAVLKSRQKEKNW